MVWRRAGFTSAKKCPGRRLEPAGLGQSASWAAPAGRVLDLGCTRRAARSRVGRAGSAAARARLAPASARPAARRGRTRSTPGAAAAERPRPRWAARSSGGRASGCASPHRRLPAASASPWASSSSCTCHSASWSTKEAITRVSPSPSGSRGHARRGQLLPRPDRLLTRLVALSRLHSEERRSATALSTVGYSLEEAALAECLSCITQTARRSAPCWRLYETATE